MNSADVGPPSPDRAPSSGKVRLVDTAGHDGSAATPADVAKRVQADRFFWLDLEGLSGKELLEFCKSLRLSPDTVDIVAHGTPRSAFRRVADSLVALAPWVTDSDPLASENAVYLCLVLTDKFLVTVHTTACKPLQRVSTGLSSVTDKDAKDHAARVMFLILDSLIDSFKPQLLAIDDRLAEIQLELLRGSGSRAVHEELVKILGVLTDGIQEFGWYAYDLEDVAGSVDRLPGTHPVLQRLLAAHRRQVDRMTDNAREIREEAKDELSHYSATMANRQARVIDRLTIVATVFLPLSFVTGYFGMNFETLTSGVQQSLWGFSRFTPGVRLRSLAG